MSAEPIEEEIPPPGVYGTEGVGAVIYTLPLANTFAPLADAETEGEADAVIIDIRTLAARTLPKPTAELVDGVAADVQNAYQAGEFRWQDAYKALRWVWQERQVPIISQADLQSGAFRTWLLDYAVAHGYRPPAHVQRYEPSPGPRPTPADHQAARSARRVHRSRVETTALTQAQAKAVQALVDRAADAVVAWSTDMWDHMLPGMHAGQVPEALSHLNLAVTVLEHQWAQFLAHPHVRSLPGLGRAISGLEASIAEVRKALEGIEVRVGDEQHATSHRLDELGTGLGALTGTVGALEATAYERMGHFEEQFAMRRPSILGDELHQVASTANRAEHLATEAASKLALTTDECLAQLCDDQANVTNPIKSGGATPSLLRRLGKVLGFAAGIAWLSSLAEALFALLDARVALSAVAADTEWVASTAVSAASAIEGDLDLWGGP